MSFRTEIFNLCKIIQQNPESKQISNFIKSLSITVVGNDSPSANNFHQIAKHSHNQFYGYLYANDNIKDYLDIFPDIRSLATDEIQLIAIGHSTIVKLIHGCLNDISSKYPKICKAMNPYWNYKPIAQKYEKANTILNDDDYHKAISEFKSSALYQKLFTSTTIELIEKLPDNDFYNILGSIDKEINTCPVSQIPKIIDDYYTGLHSNPISPHITILATILMITAIRKSLTSACSLLFTALVGNDLIVLNNDNIISFDNISKNLLYSHYSLTTTDILLNPATNTVGDIALIDCTPSSNLHLHEFGIIYSHTANFTRDMGDTSNLTLVAVDELLNPIFTLTNNIISQTFPDIKTTTPQQIHASTNIAQTKKPKISRNDMCPCGSGLKYKFCCGKTNNKGSQE